MRQQLGQDAAAVARDKLIRLLVTAAERDAIMAAAAKSGVTYSEYIRRRVFGETMLEVPPAPVIKGKRAR